MRLETDAVTVKIANDIALTFMDEQDNPVKSGWLREDVIVEVLNQMFS